MGGYLIGGRLVADGVLDAGQITVRAVPASSASFELPLNRDGSIDATVKLPLVDPNTGNRIDLPNELVPGRDFIGWVENDIIIEAGPLWGDPFEFPHKDRLVGNGIWSYFDHRFVLPVLAPGQLPRHVTTHWSGLSLRTIAARLVQQACAHPNSALPIDFEPDIAGPHERDYPGSDMRTVGEALRDLTEVEGGPNITFRPKWGADRRRIRWDMLTGSPELKQAGSDHYWDVSVPDAHARVISLERSAGELTSREFQTGTTLRNAISDSSLEGEAAQFAAANVTLIKKDYSWAAHGAVSLLLQAPTNVDGYVSVGGDAGGMRLGMEAGGTYTFSATGNVKELMSGAQVSDAGRERALVVHHRIGDAGWSIVKSTSVPNVVGAARRVHATFTLPEGTTEAFLRAYHGHAAGQIRWDAFMLTASSEPVPYDPVEVQVQAVSIDTKLTDAGFPLLESVTNRASVNRASTLQAYANEAVLRGSGHLETFSILVRRDKYPLLGTYWPGDYATLRIGDNPRVPHGTYRIRIMSLSFGRNGDVQVECAPERIASGYPVPSTKRTWLRDKLARLTASITESNRG